MADIRITPASSVMAFTSSLNYTETLTQDASGSIVLQGSGSTGRTNLFAVDGNNGRLFSIDDDLSDSLFSVNTIAGLPVIEAFADNTVNIGTFSSPAIVVNGTTANITGSLFGNATTSTTTTAVGGTTNYVSKFTSATAIGNSQIFDNGTNVGIGTTSPANKLVVASDASSTSENTYAIAAASASDKAYKTIIGYDYANDVGLIAAVRTGIGWRNISIPQGNVGIGTTSPAAKLDVIGGVGAWAANNTSTLQLFNGRLVGAGRQIANLVSYNGNGALDLYDGANTLKIHIQGSGSSYFNAGNVGIGTTSPGYKLQVAGNSYISDTLTIDGGGNTLTLRKGTGSASLAFGGTSDQASALIEGISGGGLNIYTSNGGTLGTPAWASRMRITSAGNVGIGLTNPSKKLEVNGSFKLGTNAYIEYGGSYPYTITTANTAAVGNLVFSAGLGSAAFESKIDLQGTNTAGVAGITLSTASTARMVVTADGNVGIGTTSPDAKLDVSGTGRFDDTLTVNGEIYGRTSTLYPGLGGLGFYSLVPYLENANQGGLKIKVQQGNSLVDSLTLDSSQNATFAKRGLFSDNVQIVYTGSKTNDAGLYIENDSADWGIHVNKNTSNFGIRVTSDGVNAFGIYSDAGLNKINFSGTGNATFAGNVGIGTTSPSEKLTVEGTIGIRRVGTAAVATIQQTGQGTEINAPSGYHPLIIKHNGSELARFKNDGNVGIGTTNPASNLHVNSASAGNNIFILGVSGQEQFAFQAGISGVTNAALRITETTNNYDYITLRSGNVGIGTTNPLYKLQVQDRIHIADTTSLQPKISFSENTNTSGEFVLEYNGVGSGVGNYVSFYSEVSGWVAKGNGLNYIPENGRVGIGTTSPERKLHVFNAESGGAASNANSTLVLENNTDTYVQFLTPTTAESGLLFGDTDNDAGAFVYKHSSNSFHFRTNAVSDRMIINSSGNVGIGTTSPGQKLQVSGPSGAAISILTPWAGGAYGQLRFDTGTGNSSIRSSVPGNSTNGLDFYTYSSATSETVKMSILGNGNVGIGTTNPTSKTHISGTPMEQLRIEAPGGPVTTGEPSGEIGDIAYDDTFFYIKTPSGWGRVQLDFNF